MAAKSCGPLLPLVGTNSYCRLAYVERWYQFLIRAMRVSKRTEETPSCAPLRIKRIPSIRLGRRETKDART
eukprot:scaffold3255_cov48-Attheya_sp.AAC.1